ncbi:MAG: hypothetical protein EOM03_11445 [Clostridia bacterium]|nr:hypothetical protein [Clostridia bacterium]
MVSPTIESLAELTAPHQPPCLSLYQPTHRHGPENQQDLVRYRNLLKKLESSLSVDYPKPEIKHFLEPFEELALNHEFWTQTLDGLGVLSSAGVFRVFRLRRPVAELAIVADSFHVKPLRRFLKFVGRYQILGLSLTEIKLFEGDIGTLGEIEPAQEVPRTITDALGSELTEPHQTVASYGGTGGRIGPMRHGQGGKKDEADKDARRFFRAVDRAVLEHHSRPSGLPLLLAALPEHHHLFQSISHNPFLMKEGLDSNPFVLTTSELRERAQAILEPQYQTWLATLLDEYMEAQSRGFGSDDLGEVLQGATAGRVSKLMIASDHEIVGRIVDDTGTYELSDRKDGSSDDLLDDLRELVDRMGGQVLVMPAAQIPGKTGLAATFRY